MVARYYRYKRDHFAHLAAGACAPEGYLHRLAKLTFAETYRACLEKGEPFLLQYSVDRTCDHFAEAYGFTCSQRVRQSIDLTRFFDRIEVEAAHREFRADILLTSSHRSEVLMIEMAVTHKCEPEKVACGDRIIEIQIDSEEAARSFAERRIDETALDVKLHNFVESTAPMDLCTGRCGRRLRVFRVYTGGKSVILEKTPAQFAKLHRKSVVHEAVMSPDGHSDLGYLFRDLVRAAYVAGVPVKNCFICRYHGSGGAEPGVFCKMFKAPVPSNDAVECGHYRPVDSKELAEIDRRNSEFKQQRFARRSARWLFGGHRW